VGQINPVPKGPTTFLTRGLNIKTLGVVMVRMLAKHRIEFKLPLEKVAAEVCKEEGVVTWKFVKAIFCLW
jgi:hypothetical protein